MTRCLRRLGTILEVWQAKRDSLHAHHFGLAGARRAEAPWHGIAGSSEVRDVKVAARRLDNTAERREVSLPASDLRKEQSKLNSSEVCLISIFAV